MASGETFSAHDLRGAAVDYNREREHKHKWAFGKTLGPGRQEADGKAKPWRPSQRALAHDRKFAEKEMHKGHLARKQPVLAVDCIHSDSSADEEVDEASAAPAPDADITYSYDAPKGPGQGSQVLGLALAQAVERFENHATDKLVKEEYDVLDYDGESVAGEAPRQTRRTGASEEDDYEFV